MTIQEQNLLLWRADTVRMITIIPTKKSQRTTKNPEIYVDMDGVPADFFGAWKKLICTDWREIKDQICITKDRDKDDFWLKIVTKNAMNLLSLIKGLKGKYNILSAPYQRSNPNLQKRMDSKDFILFLQKKKKETNSKIACSNQMALQTY